MKQHRATDLSAGKAPACWQRELTRHTARLESLQRLCTWLKPFAETQPKLRDGPLWGDCLAELTGQAIQPDRLNSETLPPRRDQASWPERGSKRRQAHDLIHERSARHRKDLPSRISSDNLPRRKSSLDDVLRPLELDRQVSQNLLYELAGKTLLGIDKVMSGRQPRRRVTTPPDKSSIAVTGNVMPQRDWLRSVARRAWRPLEVIGFRVAPALEEQWAIQLDGEPVTPELLNRWFGPPSGNGAHSDRSVRVGATPRQPSSTEPIQPNLSLRKISTDGEPTRAPLLVAGWTGKVESEWGFSEPIAPPAAAPSLPHLLPPQNVNEPAPALATMIARQASRQEATRTEDDLPRLATNIKRILDEEARRHGIDV